MIGDDLTVDDLAGDPHPHLARLRADAPVAHVPALGGHLVTGYAEALVVLRDPAAFTVDDPRFSTARVVGPSMLSLDGPAHARHREAYVSDFRPRRLAARFEGFVRDEVDRLVGAIGPRGELRRQLAGPLAAAVVAESLGLDGRSPSVVDQLLAWYRDIVSSVSGIAAGRPPSDHGARAMAELAEAVRPRLAGTRATLTEQEVVADAAVIMFGGIETTEGMILNATWHLLREGDARRAVAAHPELVTAAVEESLRMEPAAAVVDRYATGDILLGGTAIRAGELVMVSLAGANRDPAEFSDPDRFDLHRPNGRRHLAFAAGPHVCIGMDLARLEARVAVAGLLAHRPGIELAPGAPAPSGLVFRKPVSLPVEEGRSTAARSLWHGVGMTTARSGDGFIRCSDGHVRWGIHGAAGVVFVTLDDGGVPVVMVQLRSGFSHEGGTWSCPGGALQFDEPPLHGALREAAEEVGTPATSRLLGEHVFAPADDWSYTTVVVEVDATFGEPLNFETEAVEWIPVDVVGERRLHPGFASAWPHIRDIVAKAGRS